MNIGTIWSLALSKILLWLEQSDNWDNYKNKEILVQISEKKSMECYFRNVSEGKLFSRNNFRFVSVLNCLSKIFENVIKGQLMPFVENHIVINLHVDHLILHSMFKFT